MKNLNFKEIIQKSDSELLKYFHSEELTEEILNLGDKPETISINILNKNSIDFDIMWHFQKNEIFETKIIEDLIEKYNEYHFFINTEIKYNNLDEQIQNINKGFSEVEEKYIQKLDSDNYNIIYFIPSKMKSYFNREDAISNYIKDIPKLYINNPPLTNIYLVDLNRILLYGNISIIKNEIIIKYLLLDLKKFINVGKAKIFN